MVTKTSAPTGDVTYSTLKDVVHVCACVCLCVYMLMCVCVCVSCVCVCLCVWYVGSK